MPKIFALVDCNNFYVSCERAFNPKLKGRPVVVLSNNDGCAVARSNEVKDLGVPMGAPYFKFKEILDKSGAVVFSSNYALYGDMSQRVMSILSEFTSELEIYSIDEAFLAFDHMGVDQIEEYCREIREMVLRCTGIPVSIGVATTKTLAKVANELAKKDGRKENKLGGVLSLVGRDTTPYLKSLAVEDIWGVGRQYSKWLRASDINNAYEFTLIAPETIKKRMTIQGLRTQHELKGVRCLNLEVKADLKKGIASTRSFGSRVTTLEALKEAVAAYCTRVGEKLRKQNLAATYIYVFAMTDRFKEGYFYDSRGVALQNQTSYTPELIAHAHRCLEAFYKEEKIYKKAGVFVTGLVPNDRTKLDLFQVPEIDKERRDKAMLIMDGINRKFGKHTLKLLAQGITQPWQMLNEKRSPRFTTVWGEVLGVV